MSVKEKRFGKGRLSVSVKSFISVLIILAALIVLTGILTYVIPAGEFEKELVNGKWQIIQGTFKYIDGVGGYPIWKWPLAPFLLFGGEDSFTVIIVSVLLLVLSGSFSIIDKTGGIKVLALRLVKKFSSKRYVIIWAVSLFFMLLSAFFGIFEGVLVLVPLMMILCTSLGFDAMTALGISLLSTGVGFACAISNPFTIGLSSQIAGTNIMTGAWYRFIILMILYVATASFLTYKAKRNEQNNAEAAAKAKEELKLTPEEEKNEGKIFKVYVAFFAIVLVMLIVPSAIPALSSYSMMFLGGSFLIGTIVSGYIITKDIKFTLKSFVEGAISLSPAILILMLAGSVKFIATEAKIIDTLLYSVSELLKGTNSYVAILAIYALVLVVQFFITSASAKVMLLMPVLIPLASLIGVSKELVILAFMFGDGFTNVFFPTNPTLLVGLSLCDINYGSWVKRTLPLQLIILAITSLALVFAQFIGY